MNGTKGVKSPFHDRVKSRKDDTDAHAPKGKGKELSDNEFIREWFRKHGKHSVKGGK